MAAYKHNVLPTTGTNFKLQPAIKLVLFILSGFFSVSQGHISQPGWEHKGKQMATPFAAGAIAEDANILD